MNYWLVKSDPDTYSWEDMKKDGETFWDGVRNYAARIHLRAMKKGDKAFFYLSQTDKAIAGIVTISKEAYQDPTTDDDRWVAVDVKYESDFDKPVTLAEIKAQPKLSQLMLVRQGRLSVMPVTKAEWELIVKMSKK